MGLDCAALLSVLSVLVDVALSQSTATAPGQPLQTGPVGQFQIVGESLVSAQQLFLGTEDKVYIVDKVESNPGQVNGHPAWAVEYSVSANNAKPMDIVTNTFCAGGNVMGDGTWLNVGGNQAVTYGGLTATSQKGGKPYNDPDGRQSLRVLNPCDDGSCDWRVFGDMSTQRWYPTVETLEDGSLIILGGCENGGYVNDAGQDNPTYEFFPSQGDPIPSHILQNTLPTNLYPLTWLLPSGRILLQSNWNTSLLDYHTYEETALDPIPDAVRTYPASAGTVMLPLTPTNNWTARVLFCGGSNLQPNEWVTTWNIAANPTSTSCVTISPDVSGSYSQDDPLPEGRSMANFIFLPDGRILCLNGANLGTAGYGNNSWAIGQSYADKPVLQPIIYDPSAPQGQRWSSKGMSPSTIPRMYHSSATLLPDGSIFVAGSNPNADYNVGVIITYPTEYRVEKFYPSYYNQRRPEPYGILKQLSYGGPYFNITLDSKDLYGDVQNVQSAKVVIIRTGFSTHAMNMGQRYVELQSSYTGYANNTATLHVSQLPPNPAVLVPGPALLFVVISGIPSVGVQVMVGSGKVEKQTINSSASLPGSSVLRASDGNGSSGGGSSNSNNTKSAGFSSRTYSSWTVLFVIFASFVFASRS
ncbi:glyoxal oxidase [Guyanagaster necrorhizus]|uniref:Glyoxal oxidase n=1 Tax=Guyanagaster necrorhizus TaxID=856835 RepID=A0A9P8ASN5_9AGAR|nr:glyoxal oxidase [Guyanagaster necrorhizus MCA 3950]KAG7446598.1 glyoxal oxidase [Guyanagaster necrorhizus MCA 3950]